MLLTNRYSHLNFVVQDLEQPAKFAKVHFPKCVPDFKGKFDSMTRDFFGEEPLKGNQYHYALKWILYVILS